jgi:epoxyqueuosine reductase QueG
MGIHRNVIHPRFGNFILLGTVILDREIDSYSAPIEYNPCLECKLCVAACPTGAILPNGDFNFSACYTHTYREFMGGFGDWVETIMDRSVRFIASG